MSATLTKLVQELLNAIQQTREAQTAAEELATQIRTDGLPDLEPPEQVTDVVYEGYELQAQIQQLRATRQDALEIINELVGLLLFIKSKIIAAHDAQKRDATDLLTDCENELASIRSRYALIRQSKQALLLNIRTKHAVLKNLQSKLAEVGV